MQLACVESLAHGTCCRKSRPAQLNALGAFPPNRSVVVAESGTARFAPLTSAQDAVCGSPTGIAMWQNAVSYCGPANGCFWSLTSRTATTAFSTPISPLRFVELYPRVGFIVTNLSRPAECVVAFYNQRGTAGLWYEYHGFGWHLGNVG